MFRIPPSELAAPDIAALLQLQSDVKTIGGYAAQVAEGKRKWGIKPKPLFSRVKTRLEAMCSGNIRCVYCEDSRADEIEHMRPKDLYPEQVFLWHNYVLACGPCNGPKNNRFAVIRKGGRNWVEVTRAPGSPVTPPANGISALIDPRMEDPLKFIWLDMSTWRFTPKLDITPRASLRASFTIDVLRLNSRDELLRGRRRAFSGYLARLREFSGESPSWNAKRRLEFIEDFRAESYRTVWLEMLRQRQALPAVRRLLGVVPEALAW